MIVRKRFGQHFLEPAWVEKVVRAIGPQATETFVEIGPGRGALTRPLLDQARRVVAFEIDRDLAAALRASHGRLTVVEGDFLESANRLGELVAGRFRVAGNLPYNAASPILLKLLDLVAAGVPIVDATLMFQREVADRLVAAPGGRDYGVLSVLVQHVADVERLLRLPPGAFRPPPSVHSVLVRLAFHGPEPPVADGATFAALVRAIFSRRRKTLANALLAFPPSGRRPPGALLARLAIDGSRRPETLTVAELARLSDAYVPGRATTAGAVLP